MTVTPRWGPTRSVLAHRVTANVKGVTHHANYLSDEAELWRAQVVVHLPDRAPRRRSAATGSEALPPVRQQVFWESRSLRIDLRVVPAKRKISWPLAAEMGADE